MSQLIPIQENDGVQAVMGRDLHAFLEVGRDYTNWFKDMCQYGFSAGQDFTPITAKTSPAGGRPRVDHIITLDMAKELSMIQRTDKGKQARQYFIECEKQAKANTPAIPQTYAEALEAAAAQARRAEELEAQRAIDAPKIEYVDTYVTDTDLIQFRTLANQLNIGEQRLRAELEKHGWIYNRPLTRWSNRENRKVTENQWRAKADKKQYFHLVPQHQAPRLNGEVRQTLKITPQGATAISRALKTWGILP